ncbi:hypothetical protein SEUCBS139899_002290 [Sporothrix eucalyptigena]|uniref:Uncharacterized protein n=1 Tax=Sporothrix eucalyptigena TaxID=1812306 RepID=A0ABP0BUZ2_9PEZI
MSSLAVRRMARRPALEEKLRHMAQQLHPLVNAGTGAIHPAFPMTIVQFWLLTDDQLNALASFYHQRTPHALKECYPCPVYWPRHGLSLEDKRRKFGRFIGLRGCETPCLPSWNKHHDKGYKDPSCRGHCPVSWDARGNACFQCSMRKINEILASGEAITWEPVSKTTMVLKTKPAPSEYSWNSMTETDVDSWDSSSATDVDSDVDMADEPMNEEPEPQCLTVDDIIRNAQRARLEANAGEEALRRKTGHY